LIEGFYSLLKKLCFWVAQRFTAAVSASVDRGLLRFAEKTLFLGGAAVYRCDMSFVLTRASAPEVGLGFFQPSV
jgi:hypothetical protein